MLVLVVLVAGGAVYGGIKYFGKSDSSSNKSNPSSNGSNPSSNDMFTLPDTVDGLPRAASSAQVDAMKQNLSQSLPSAKVTAAAYHKPSDTEHQVILVGIETPISDPESEVHDGFVGFGTTAPGLSTPKDFPAGSQGGAMQCASGDVGNAEVPLSVCIVADNKGMIFVLDYSATEQHAADVTSAVRPEFEHT